MVGYKLSKNDWVTPFFVIFRSVREILLVTVFLEHPVSDGDYKKSKEADLSKRQMTALTIKKKTIILW